VIYLLDVNTLVALGFLQHEFHGRVTHWVKALAARGVPEFATCSITELGFVSVLAQAPLYGITVAQSKTLLSRMKARPVAEFTFLADTHGISDLPQWVKLPKQVTDGHLLELAKAHGSMLATLDERIPGALLIPGKK
jgi:uncharacterized protein